MFLSSGTAEIQYKYSLFCFGLRNCNLCQGFSGVRPRFVGFERMSVVDFASVNSVWLTATGWRNRECWAGLVFVVQFRLRSEKTMSVTLVLSGIPEIQSSRLQCFKIYLGAWSFRDLLHDLVPTTERFRVANIRFELLIDFLFCNCTFAYLRWSALISLRRCLRGSSFY